MKSLLVGLAGVLTACLIFATLVLSRSNIEVIMGYPIIPSDSNRPPVNMTLTVYGFNEPRGIGSQALLMLNVTSQVDVSNATLQIDFSKAYPEWPSSGIQLINGTTTWAGNLSAGEPVLLFMTINATEVGYCRIVAQTLWKESWTVTGARVQLGIVVLENEIMVIEDYKGILIPFWPPGYPTPPILPYTGEVNFTKLYPYP